LRFVGDSGVHLRQQVRPRNILVLLALRRSQNRNLRRGVLFYGQGHSLIQGKSQNLGWRIFRQRTRFLGLLRMCACSADRQPKKQNIENDRRTLAPCLLATALFGFFGGSNFFDNRLVQTALGD